MVFDLPDLPVFSEKDKGLVRLGGLSVVSQRDLTQRATTGLTCRRPVTSEVTVHGIDSISGAGWPVRYP